MLVCVLCVWERETETEMERICKCALCWVNIILWSPCWKTYLLFSAIYLMLISMEIHLQHSQQKKQIYLNNWGIHLFDRDNFVINAWLAALEQSNITKLFAITVGQHSNLIFCHMYNFDPPYVARVFNLQLKSFCFNGRKKNLLIKRQSRAN